METEKKQAQFEDVFRPFLKNYPLIIIPFLCIFGTVALLTFLARPVYEAKAALYIGTGDKLTLDANQVAVQRYLVKNQIPILKSRHLAADVISRFLKSEQQDSLFILGTRRPPDRLAFLKSILRIPVKPDSLIRKLTFIEQVESFRDATAISEQLETNVILLLGRSPSPLESAFMVNTWVDAYLEYDKSLSQGDASESKEFLETKLKEVESALQKSEVVLTEFQKKEKAVALTSETEQIVNQLTNFESQYNQTRTDLESNQNQLEYLRNQLDESKKNLLENMTKFSSPILQELQKKMAELVAEKAAYEAQLIGAGLDAEHDERLTQLESRLNGIREKITQETAAYLAMNQVGVDPLNQSENLITQLLQLETQKQSLQARSDALKKVVDDYNARLSRLPEKSLRLAQLERDVQVNRDIYKLLRQRYEEAKIKSTGLGGNITVLDRAQPPLYPVYPRKKFNLALAMILGLIVGVSLAFAKDFFEDTLWKIEDIEKLDLKVIGSIPSKKEKSPHSSSRSSRKNQKIERAKAIYPYLITNHEPQSAISEAYRVIRTFLHYQMQKQNARTILFTSPGLGEGKSTTVTNIAIASAQKGIKTILIDCDLRKPVLDLLLLGTPKTEGLSTYLRGQSTWQNMIRETAIKRLYLLPAGPPSKHTSELLSSKLMTRMIKEMSETYQMILFDCPPVLPVTDAIVLSESVNGVVVISRMGKTTRRGLQSTVERLKSIHAPIWGAVVTGMPGDSHYRYEHYYTSYQNKNNEEL